MTHVELKQYSSNTNWLALPLHVQKLEKMLNETK